MAVIGSDAKIQGDVVENAQYQHFPFFIYFNVNKFTSEARAS